MSDTVDDDDDDEASDANSFLRVKANARVRFPYVRPNNDSDGPTYQVVRILTEAGDPVQSDGDQVQVVLRHGRRWRDVLAAIAFSDDRPMSHVLTRLISAHHGTELDEDPPMDILGDRGRPSTDTERTINLVIERDASGGGWTFDSIGELVDQSYYLTEDSIEKLETLCRTHDRQLTPGQVVDWLLMLELAKVSAQLGRRA
ncbi:MAG: hypothetical protein AB7O24_30770 [Kofleriaceae bacterium]